MRFLRWIRRIWWRLAGVSSLSTLVFEHDSQITGINERLNQLEKKAEATRRKVYRDGENGENGDTPIPATSPTPAVQLSLLAPGQPIPPDLLKYL